jgi:hypothetical protein
MSREAFDHVHDLIKDDEEFISDGNRPQREVKIQLAAFLVRVGNTSAQKTGDVTGISEGAVYLYCERVQRALRRLRERFLHWPSEERRNILKDEMAERGFDGCIGICDGSLFRLAEIPLEDGQAYYCRKKFYGVCIGDL